MIVLSILNSRLSIALPLISGILPVVSTTMTKALVLAPDFV
jgi:hypothetical protein